MKIRIITLFPEMIKPTIEYSIVKRAREAGKVEIDFINIRDFGIGKHKIVDDTPYGGGHGMVLRADVLSKAIASVTQTDNTKKIRVVLLSAGGKKFDQETAKEYSKMDELVLICGHYEGVDARILLRIDDELSIGDYVNTGGELPAMIVVDAVTRLLPGVLKEGVVEHESYSFENSFGRKLLEYPQYTKPLNFEGAMAPEVLLSGHHLKIEEWRMDQALKKTKKIRPDLLKDLK